MKLTKRYFAFIIAVTTMFASFTIYAADSLCPRGQYTFTEVGDGISELVAKVTLPTSGYKLSLTVGPELIEPPFVYLRCDKPSGQVLQVLTEYTQPFRVNFNKIFLIDANGSQFFQAEASAVTTGAAEEKICSTDKECTQVEFCDTTPKCHGNNITGVCRSKPQRCPMILDPITGCDGKTYMNRCAAAAEGQPSRGKM